MDDPWKQLPRAAAIVYVGVLAAGTGRIARAEQEPAAAPGEAVEPSEDMLPIAPTCGPSCHGGGEELTPVYVPLEQAEEEAPTCGPDCHDPNARKFQEVQPPPLPPESKKGCAVESIEDERGLALLGLGLLAGVAARRRKRFTSPAG